MVRASTPTGLFLHMTEPLLVTEQFEHATSASSTMGQAATHTSEDVYGSGVHVVLKAEEIGSVMGFPITNSLVMTLVASALLLGFSVLCFFESSALFLENCRQELSSNT